MNRLKMMAAVALAAGTMTWQAVSATEQVLESPDGSLRMTFTLATDGTPQYALSYKGKAVVLPSPLGFELRGVIKATKLEFGPKMISKVDERPTESLHDGFMVESVERDSCDMTWNPVWGEESEIRCHYNELTVNLFREKSEKRMAIRFRLFDDGLGFRYEFP